MTNSIIAIKGNYLERQPEIFESFKLEDLKKDKQFDSLDALYTYLFGNYFSFSNNDIALRGVWANSGWTIIGDPEMVDIFDEEALLKLSNKFNADVLTFLIQTTSNSFGFAKYNASCQRNFFSSEGKITVNTGLALPEEGGLNINDQIFVDDIINLANTLGIYFEQTHEQIFTAKQLGYNEEMKAYLQQFKSAQAPTSTEKTKSWWKLW